MPGCSTADGERGRGGVSGGRAQGQAGRSWRGGAALAAGERGALPWGVVGVGWGWGGWGGQALRSSMPPPCHRGAACRPAGAAALLDLLRPPGLPYTSKGRKEASIGLGLGSNVVSGNRPCSRWDAIASSSGGAPGGSTSPTLALVPHTVACAGACSRHALRGRRGTGSGAGLGGRALVDAAVRVAQRRGAAGGDGGSRHVCAAAPASQLPAHHLPAPAPNPPSMPAL